jgi:hypothetical protein
MKTVSLCMALSLVCAPAFAEAYRCVNDGGNSTVTLTVEGNVLYVGIIPHIPSRAQPRYPIVVSSPTTITAVLAERFLPEVDAVVINKESLQYAWAHIDLDFPAAGRRYIVHGKCQVIGQ